MLVASMDTVWAGTVTPAAERTLQRTTYAPGAVHLERGEEMGRFNMGSTVISILPPGVVDAADSPRANDAVRMGQKIATLVSPGTDNTDRRQIHNDEGDPENGPEGAMA